MDSTGRGNAPPSAHSADHVVHDKLHDPGALFVGLDCGGTRTRCLLIVRGAGHGLSVLAAGEAGPGNLQDAGATGARAAIEDAWQQAWRNAGQPPRPAAAVFCGIAGAAREEHRDTVKELLHEVGMAAVADIEVDHDIRVALAGALLGAPGIVVIAGTGSACYGRTEDGRTWRAGGFGSFLDDRGSAFDLAREALTACGRAHDRRAQKTALYDALREHLGLEDWPALLAWARLHQQDRVAIAKLAPLVVQAATHGDRVARRIVDQGTDELALCVTTVARELGEPTPAVSATGGLASSGDLWWNSFGTALERRVQGARVSRPAASPVFGAALLSLRRAEVDLDKEILSVLARSAGKVMPADSGSGGLV